MKKFLKRYLIKIRIAVLKIFASTKFTSSLYYIFLSRDFDREHQAVLKGRLTYYKRNIVEKNSYYLLRRNIHRLEKGLIMKERRNIFALEYIQETVTAYIKVLQSEEIEQKLGDKNLKWYSDVLEEYFSAVDLNNPILNKAQKDFKKYFETQNRTEKPSVPYARDFSKLKVDYDSFLKLCELRRSVRWYENKKVPRELMDKAIRAASLSPSACNRQPFEFRIFDEQELVQKIANITWGTRGFSQNFPTITVLIGNLEAYFDERDRHVIYIDASLAAMSFMLALETLGLSSCPINWPDVSSFENQMKEILGLQKNERPIMLISCGYPDKEALVPFSEKKDLFEVRSYNQSAY